MSKVISLRLKDSQVERLERAARRFGRTASETAALLLEEALRQRAFASIEFRDSPVGRQAYLKGTRLAAWHVAWLAPSFGADAERLAAHLELPPVVVAAALAYTAAYPEDIEAAVADQGCAAEDLPRLIPNMHAVQVDAAAP